MLSFYILYERHIRTRVSGDGSEVTNVSGGLEPSDPMSRWGKPLHHAAPTQSKPGRGITSVCTVVSCKQAQELLMALAGQTNDTKTWTHFEPLCKTKSIWT